MRKAVAVAALGLASLSMPNANASMLQGSTGDPVTVSIGAYGLSPDDLKADHLGRVNLRGELTITAEFTRMAGDTNCCNSNCRSSNC